MPTCSKSIDPQSKAVLEGKQVPSGVRAQPAYEWLLTRDEERD